MHAGNMRPALFAAALLVMAGCSGLNSATQASAPSVAPGTHAGEGHPFATAGRNHTPARSVRTAYAAKGSLVYEGDQEEAAVNIYQTKAVTSNPAPIATIHVSRGCPYGLVDDKKGTLYVADNCGGNDVEEYPKGSTTEKTSITDGISNPLGLAMDKSGTLYVSNYPGAITEYAKGTTTPSQTITGQGLSEPFGLALDKQGNLYIADFGASQVFEVAAGTTTVTALNLQDLVEPLGVSVDQKTGYLWVTDGEGDKVNVYQLGNTSPVESFAGHGNPYAISIENHGKPNGETAESDLGTDAVYMYAPGQYTPYATLTNGIELPTGLLVTKP